MQSMRFTTGAAVYNCANVDWVADPITLARGVGLLVAPLLRDDRTHLLQKEGRETWLFYRQLDHGEGNHVGRLTGMNVFLGVAEFCGCDVGDLVLPLDCLGLPLSEILEAQVYAPEKYLIDKYLKTKGSGVVRRVRG